MKKYLVIGNPIEHSLSPKLHNYWIKKNNIDAIYDKKLLKEEELESIILRVKKEEIARLRVLKGFRTEAALAEAAGMSRQHVNNIMRKDDGFFLKILY